MRLNKRIITYFLIQKISLLEGFNNFKDGVFTGKYQDLKGNNIEFTMSRDSLTTEDQRIYYRI